MHSALLLAEQGRVLAPGSKAAIRFFLAQSWIAAVGVQSPTAGYEGCTSRSDLVPLDQQDISRH
jgi:hypothetical protein